MAVFWGAGADSDDVVQEAFVKAYAALPRFRSDGEFRPWLLCIVRNETRSLFRGRTRRAAREEMARNVLDLPRATRRMPLSALGGARSCWPVYGDWPSRWEKW
jgi:DNA-directed RNA polymerase specialized sigma24 family protein